MDKIQVQPCAGAAEYRRAADAQHETGPCVVAECQQALGLRTRERAALQQFAHRPRTHRIAAQKPQRQRTGAGTAESKQRPHPALQCAGEVVRHTAGDAQRGEHKKRKQRRQHRFQTQGKSLPRRCGAVSGIAQQSRGEQNQQRRQRRPAHSMHDHHLTVSYAESSGNRTGKFPLRRA